MQTKRTEDAVTYHFTGAEDIHQDVLIQWYMVIVQKPAVDALPGDGVPGVLMAHVPNHVTTDIKPGQGNVTVVPLRLVKGRQCKGGDVMSV